MSCCATASTEAINLTSRVMFIKHDAIGEGELGVKLLAGFMATLENLPNLPSKIIFVNRGVFCTTTDGAVCQSLKKLQSLGVKIYSCGTCLDFFGTRAELKVGEVGNAKDTLEALISSDSAITL